MLCNHDPDSIASIDGLYSYALVLTHNHAAAEDLVQETYVRALRAMDSLQSDSNLKAWLFTILRNIWLNQLRKQKLGQQSLEIIHRDGVADCLTEPSKDALGIYMSKIETKHVRAAINKLPLDLREVILLREYEELTYRQIARVLACPAGTVMSRLARARTRLRTVLSETLMQSTIL
jgi:RNA polymerase sigma-70 factor (ECF subfamily)